MPAPRVEAEQRANGPYTGPPATGRYHAPPVVPGAAPWRFAPRPPQFAHPGAGAMAPSWGRGLSGPPPPRLSPLELPKGTAPHDAPQPFLLAMRSRDWGWWRALLGLVLFTVLYSVAAVVVVLISAVTGGLPDLAVLDLVDPLVLLITNASLIVAIPIVWLCWVVCHGMGIGWSSSVLGRVRWRLFAPLTGRALLSLGVGIGVSVGLGFALDGGQVTGEVTGPDSSFIWLVLVVLFTTPLQSAAEEFVFRGYLSQAVAGWIRAPRVGAVVAGVLTAALFSLAHVPPDFLTFADRFAFGLAASAVVWLTGGLEAAIVLHAVNNVLLFILVGALGEGIDTDAVPAGTGLLVVVLDLLAMGGYVALVARWRRRAHPQTRTNALDLRRPGPVPVAARWPGPDPAEVGQGPGGPGGVSPWARPEP